MQGPRVGISSLCWKEGLYAWAEGARGLVEGAGVRGKLLAHEGAHRCVSPSFSCCCCSGFPCGPDFPGGGAPAGSEKPLEPETFPHWDMVGQQREPGHRQRAARNPRGRSALSLRGEHAQQEGHPPASPHVGHARRGNLSPGCSLAFPGSEPCHARTVPSSLPEGKPSARQPPTPQRSWMMLGGFFCVCFFVVF